MIVLLVDNPIVGGCGSLRAFAFAEPSTASLFMPTRASRTQMDSPCDGPEHITGVPALVDEEGIEQVVIPSDEDDKLSMQKHMRSIVEEAGEPLCRICMCEA